MVTNYRQAQSIACWHTHSYSTRRAGGPSASEGSHFGTGRV